MAWNNVTWSADEVVSSTKLNQMQGNSDHLKNMIAYLPIITLAWINDPDDIGHVMHNTSYSSFYINKFYKPESSDYARFIIRYRITDPPDTGYVRVTLGGSVTHVFDVTGDSDWHTEDSGDIDISSLTDDSFHDIELEAYTTDALAPVEILSFNAFLKTI